MNRAHAAVAGTVGIFVCIQLGALALVQPFEAAGYQTVEDPTNPTNSLLYIGAILVATAVMLAAFRYDADVLVRLLVVGSAAFISYYVFTVLFPGVEVGGVDAVAAVGALALSVLLVVHPEWYVIDAAGVVMGAGAAALFGISFGLLPALLLLVGLAVYDAISVYGTEHMLHLASGVMDLKVPVVLVVPLALSYSYLDGEVPDATGDSGDPEERAADGEPADDDSRPADGKASPDGETPVDGEARAEGPGDRDAFFIGLGDAVMPTVLVASAAFFAPASVATVDLVVVTAALPAVTAMVGTVVGLLLLMRMVMAGRAHAGLPLLNGGAIAGYLLGALAVGIPLVEALGLG